MFKGGTKRNIIGSGVGHLHFEQKLSLSVQGEDLEFMD